MTTLSTCVYPTKYFGNCAITTANDKLFNLSLNTDLYCPDYIQLQDKQVVINVLTLLDGDIQKYNLPLCLNGTSFQISVWEALRTIPYGTTVSYAKLAEMVGKPKAVRAVATACANNPIAVIIPCHRVIYSNGKIGNYRWDKHTKAKLLGMETKFLLSGKQ